MFLEYSIGNLFDDNTAMSECSLKPLIKWPGGKEKELKFIIPNIPNSFENYFEPFVGGGAVFMAMKARKYYINDLSNELIALYKNIANQDKEFFKLIQEINYTWLSTFTFFSKHTSLIDKYISYRGDSISDIGLRDFIKNFCKENESDIIDLLSPNFDIHINVLLDEVQKNLFRKMKRMKELENEKHLLSQKDLEDNIETALKGSVYMYYRFLYNDKNLSERLHSAVFFFIRNFCYSGMFRYNDKGEFNVPYGGIAYNSKNLLKKIEYYQSINLYNHFLNTEIDNLDFEEFLRFRNPGEKDFVFLDPPYDTEFSTYAQNEFNRQDQTRLASFMINECKAKWMLIIKYTDFIYNLYNKVGINIRTFDKEYVVSFMNRNDRKVTHLLITNY